MLSKKVIDSYYRTQGYKLLWYYGFSHCEFDRDTDVFYIIPINYFVRYWRKLYWGFVRLMYKIGFIDVAVGECFRWSDFWRIKSH